MKTYRLAKNISRFFQCGIILLLIFSMNLPVQRVSAAGSDYSAWNDLGIIYTAPSGSAYYPSAIYDANGFGSGSPLYKMWYSDGSGGVYVVASLDGINWGARSAGTGLFSGAHHVQVLYDANCFGVLPCNAATAKYKIWYWNSPSLYTINALATAQSINGIAWTNNVTSTQSSASPIVTGSSSDWNYGTYGPISLSYQAGAPNTGTNPWNYNFVMYYDGGGGQHEVTGLAYSADGLNWIRYSSAPVLSYSLSGWDSDDSAYGTVMQLGGTWHFWYSGGSCLYDAACPVSEGIGYASSPDGKTWTKSSTNPIFHISQGVSYRNQRVYTPAVINDGSGILKMYYSAVGTDGKKKIGLATLAPGTAFVDDGWAGLTLGTQVTFPGDPNPHFFGLDAFDSIQKGINAAASGGTVNVAPGTYLESLIISKPLTLHSVSGAADTIINGGDPYSVFITSKNVTVDGFTITNPSYTGGSDAAGVVVEPSLYETNINVRITNNLIHDIGAPGRLHVAYGNCGINLGFANGVEIDHNEIYNIIHSAPTAWANGICIWGGDASTPADNIIIHDNSFHDISSPYPADAAISTQTDVGVVIVYDNSIISTLAHPTEFGVEVRSTNVVDARHNWWGNVSGPSGVAPGTGAAITVNVLYDPVWTTPTGSPVIPPVIPPTSTPVPKPARVGIGGLIPLTGFAPDRVSALPVQPAAKAYSDFSTGSKQGLGDLWLEIPRLGVQIPILGVPQTTDGWDVSWLGDQAGWLNGSAFPTWAGNSVLTAHVYDAYGQPGPFVHLNWLWYGDKVIIHAWGQQYVYEVREVTQVSPEALSSVMKHQELPWLTLVICRGYDPASDSYKYRVLVRAVQVAIK